MSRKFLRAPARNPVKGNVDDEEYEAFLRFKEAYGFDSDAATLRRIFRIALFGVMGTLPAPLQAVASVTDQNGPRIPV
ncbi:hypothetical protein [Cupriavidus sp. D384]|uniref:hypothetical protein n=1 Tax=Cupriavidus sp. D384 TaxID=1538095 RepID=UPI000834B72B|nr:hypothetical protein [Cupriavidus sp. D384]